MSDYLEQRQLATIVFTDIVGSTQLKSQWGEREAVALVKRHHAVIRQVLGGFDEGNEIETAGDSFLILFGKPSDAVKFALQVQTQLRKLSQETHPICDRIGIHVGEVLIGESSGAAKSKALSGLHVDTCARVMALAQGDQILLTRFAFDSARSVLKGEEIADVGALRWMNHGLYVLKGVEEPVEICEVGEADLAPLKPPPSSDKAQRHVAEGSEPMLGWRPALEQVVPNTRWMLERKLGEGGFGEVWLGRHETLKERRVFKFCFRADRVRSLKREVTLFRLLKEKVGHHQNIVGIQEVFFDTPPFYIVMDYETGQDLRGWWEAQGGADKVPLATRLEIVAQVADALQAAHEAGVIHRDVKPSNILVATAGGTSAVSALKTSGTDAESSRLVAKLTDFGIGQVVSQEALAGLTKMGFTQTMMSPGSTQTGTHIYMAPELLAGKPASIRSDIYSLGVVLYQLLVGDFSHPLTTDWARRIADPLLREDLQKCFAGDPEERFTNGNELARSLRALEQRQAEQEKERAARAAEATTAQRCATVRRRAAVTLVIAVLALAVASVFYLVRRSASSGLGLAPGREILAVTISSKNNPAPMDENCDDSLASELVDRLRKVQAFKIGRIPSYMMAARREDLLTRLAQGHTSTLLEGTIDWTGNRFQVEGRLVRTSDATLFWEKTYRGDSRDLLALVGDMVEDVAKALNIRLTTAERGQVKFAQTRIPQAYRAYLQGKRSGLHGEAPNSIAIDALERAVVFDKNFALAFATLGREYAWKWLYSKPDEKEWELKAASTIDKALALAPNLAEAHLARSVLLWNPIREFPHEAAIVAAREALRLNPQLEEAYDYLSLIYNHIGLFDETMPLANRLAVLNPLHAGADWAKANALAWQGEYQAALVSVANVPPNWNGAGIWYAYKAWAHFQLGQTNEANATLDDFARKNIPDTGGLAMGVRAMLYARAGDIGAAQQVIAAAEAQRKGFMHFHHTAYHLASAFALMNQTNRAIYWLQQTVKEGFNCYPLFLKDRNLNSLRAVHEFKQLMAREEAKHNEYKEKFGIRPTPSDGR